MHAEIGHLFPLPPLGALQEVSRKLTLFKKLEEILLRVNGGCYNLRLNFSSVGEAHTRYLAPRKEDFRNLGQIAYITPCL